MPRILIVDDDADHQVLTRRAIAATYRERIETADSLGSAMHALATNAFDLVILDLNLSDSSGLDTLRAVLKAAPLAAVVVVSNDDDRQLGVKAISLGAQDYMPKFELQTTFLERLVAHAIARQQRSRPGSRFSLRAFDGALGRAPGETRAIPAV